MSTDKEDLNLINNILNTCDLESKKILEDIIEEDNKDEAIDQIQEEEIIKYGR